MITHMNTVRTRPSSSLLLSLITILNVFVVLHGQSANVCSKPMLGVCLQTLASTTLISYARGTPQALSMDTCCSACLLAPTCVAWQTAVPYGSAANAAPRCDLLTAAVSINATGQLVCNSTRVVPVERVGRSTTNGIWMQHGDLRTLISRGFLIGSDLTFDWATVEPSDGVYDWSTLTDSISEANNGEFYLSAQLQTGPDAPMWIYARAPTLPSVPAVNITPKVGSESQPSIFPYYLDATYQALFLRVQRAFATYLNSLPFVLRRRIVSVQAMYGSTGDDTPWHGKPNNGINGTQYTVSDDQWSNFTQSLVPSLCDIFSSSLIPILWNFDDARLPWALSICPGILKAGMASHGFQINSEIDDYAFKGVLCHNESYRCRGEDWPFPATGGYLEGPVWAEYWHLMYLLWFGVDRPNLSQPSLDYAINFPSYYLFNKYSSSIRPPATKWVGAIIALRDGLDANDNVRFSEATFGAGSSSRSLTRNAAIAAAFAIRGARQDDPASAVGPDIVSRAPSRMNDVGYRISNCNWGNDKVMQIAPNETSIGWWRVGPKTSPYGRFARGFEVASGKNSMPFVLDTRLWGGLPFGSVLVSLRLRIIYFDAGGGDLTIAYDSTRGCVNATTIAVGTSSLQNATGGGGTWSEILLNLTDSYFNRRCGPRNADILLSSTADTIIHGFEIYSVGTLTMTPTTSRSPTNSPTSLASTTSTASSASQAITPSPTPTPSQLATSSTVVLGGGGGGGGESMSNTSNFIGIPGIAGIAVAGVLAMGLFIFCCLRLLNSRRQERKAKLISSQNPTAVHASSSSSLKEDKMITNPAAAAATAATVVMSTHRVSPLSSVAPTLNATNTSSAEIDRELLDTVFYLETEGDESWYVSTLSGESCWVLPEGGRVVQRIID